MARNPIVVARSHSGEPLGLLRVKQSQADLLGKGNGKKRMNAKLMIYSRVDNQVF